MSVYHCLSHRTGYGSTIAHNGLHCRYAIFMHITSFRTYISTRFSIIVHIIYKL